MCVILPKMPQIGTFWECAPKKYDFFGIVIPKFAKSKGGALLEFSCIHVHRENIRRNRNM